MKEPKAIYRNRSDADIVVEIGEAPGEKPRRWECKAGGTVEGPANYAEVFARNSLVLEKRIEPAFDLPTDRPISSDELNRISANAEKAFNEARSEIRRLGDDLAGAKKHEVELTAEAVELRANVETLTKENADLRAAVENPPKPPAKPPK